jgi:hypothetical protein
MREAIDLLSEGAPGWRQLGGKRREVHARIVKQAPRYRQRDGPKSRIGACDVRPLARSIPEL